MYHYSFLPSSVRHFFALLFEIALSLFYYLLFFLPLFDTTFYDQQPSSRLAPGHHPDLDTSNNLQPPDPTQKPLSIPILRFPPAAVAVHIVM